MKQQEGVIRMSSIVGIIDFKNNLLEYADKFHQMNGSLAHLSLIHI